MSEPVEVSAGGVVVRRGDAGLEVVLAEQRDRNTGRRTVRLPKGKGEPGETLEETALREVAEETGLAARILRPLGEVRYRYFEAGEQRTVAKRVHYFLMRHVGRAGPRDVEMDRVYWTAIGTAVSQLSFDAEREMVERARTALEESTTPPL
jgi:8-oxo-dGTP pyrophosphatase MutT (NUDIX family)